MRKIITLLLWTIVVLCILMDTCFADTVSMSGSRTKDYSSEFNAYYYMNSDGGDEVDRSGSGETLTQTSGTIPTSTNVLSGWHGTSRVAVKGDTETLAHSDGGSTDISGTEQSISLSALIYVTSTGFHEFYPIISKNGTSGNYQYMLYAYFWESATFSIGFRLSDDGTNLTTAETTGSWEQDTWYRVTAVYDSTEDTMSIYVDGVLATATNNPKSHSGGINDGNGTFQIGSETAVNRYSDMLVDDAIVEASAWNSVKQVNIDKNGGDGMKGGND